MSTTSLAFAQHGKALKGLKLSTGGLRTTLLKTLRVLRLVYNFVHEIGNFCCTTYNVIMITIISYIGILSGFLVFTTVVYLGLLKIKLI